MVLDSIRKKIRRYFDDFDDLESVEEMYDECIESIENKGFGSNGIVGWIQFYKQDVEKMKSDFRTTPVYRVTSVDSELDDAPPLVKDIYGEYKSRNPLLHGGENSVSMGARGEDRKRFNKKAKQHIEFLRELRRELKRAKSDLESAYRKRSEIKAKEQRDKKADFDMYEEMETTPIDLKENFSEILEESLESDLENDTDEEDEEDQEDARIMMPYQLVFFLIKNIRREKENEMYDQLKSAHPEQARKIETKIHGVNDLRRYKGNLDGFLRIDDDDIEYIKKYVNQDEITETPQQHRERIKES